MSKKILVIEDEGGIRDNIKILLESESFKVIAAHDGNEGIIKAKLEKPDLIVCDIMMPGIDGYEVIKSVNSQNNGLLIPFVFLTAKVERADFRKGMELGADDYIYKPYEAGELLRAIHVRLEKYDAINSYIQEDSNKTTTYGENDKILFRTGKNIERVTIGKIIYLKADRQYSNVFLDEKKKFVIKRSLNKWEEVLPENLFVRIHRAIIINLNHVLKIEKTINNIYKVHFTNTDKIFEVSRRYFKNIKKFIKVT